MNQNRHTTENLSLRMAQGVHRLLLLYVNFNKVILAYEQEFNNIVVSRASTRLPYFCASVCNLHTRHALWLIS